MKARTGVKLFTMIGVTVVLCLSGRIAHADVISYYPNYTSSVFGGDVYFNPVAGTAETLVTPGSMALPFEIWYDGLISEVMSTGRDCPGFSSAQLLIGDDVTGECMELNPGSKVLPSGVFETLGISCYSAFDTDAVLGFRFKTTGATDYNYGYYVFSISSEFSEVSDEETEEELRKITLKSTHYESDAGVAITVVPEPTVGALLAFGAIGMIVGRRLFK